MKKEIKILLIGVAVLVVVFCVGILSLLSLNKRSVPVDNKYSKINESDLQKRLSDLSYGNVTSIEGDQIEILQMMEGLVVLPEKDRTKIKFKTTDGTRFTGSCSNFSKAESEDATTDDSQEPTNEETETVDGEEGTENIVSGGSDSEEMCEVAKTDVQVGNTVTIKEAGGVAVSVTIH